jgi:hypothetical protein
MRWISRSSVTPDDQRPGCRFGWRPKLLAIQTVGNPGHAYQGGCAPQIQRKDGLRQAFEQDYLPHPKGHIADDEVTDDECKSADIRCLDDRDPVTEAHVTPAAPILAHQREYQQLDTDVQGQQQEKLSHKPDVGILEVVGQPERQQQAERK